MEHLSGEVLKILYGLMPGFVAALILHSFTRLAPKKSDREKLVQAIVFVGIIQAIVIAVRWCLIEAGGLISFGSWSANCELVWSYVIAVGFGFAAAFAVNKDVFHAIGRKLHLTKETIESSEWCYAFDRHEWYVVLHLKDGRRLYGWPEHWPNKSDVGHFTITQPAWFRPDGSAMDALPQLWCMLIPATDVRFVEMYKTQKELEELGLSREQVQKLQEPLAALHGKDDNHVRESESGGLEQSACEQSAVARTDGPESNGEDSAE